MPRCFGEETTGSVTATRSPPSGRLVIQRARR
jgi:hypothetical protein